MADLVTMSSSVRALDNSFVHKVKSTWRAQDGESVEQIVANVSKVAHFVPRMWGTTAGADGTERVFFSWTRHRDNRSHEEYVITWKIAPDGVIKIDSLYAKPIELGWRAFALFLIASEIRDGEKDVNLRFLRDPSNFNFVTITQGKLGDLLRRGRCTVVEPVDVDYLPKVSEEQTTKGDLWRVLLLVNCNISGPHIFTRNGVVAFEKREGQGWEPQSVFARRIASRPLGSWFDDIEPNERDAQGRARKALANERRERLRSAAP
ncbi:nodulate formation efficiency C protein [Bradyrhizobium sp. BEA-2-5]|uniref:nodulate formation efficiency C protein n=1 Tax=Bradyrhizobium sp. BEA-2-5 TaxID=3080015 RepID=UPI00293E813A|nr:nodulate formation efficiency C protein [Bradyrhizobium sp. BEA-2-5]WOH80483.1 nodulate formation efficiency C protein [Bradyrhizobium sp. BEA-2-5]